MRTRDYYDSFSTTYDAPRDRGYHRLIDDLEVGIVGPLAGGARVLEAGCGTGLLLERLRPLAGAALGVDLSGGMLAAARRRGQAVAQASLLELPFPDQAFDVVYSFKVLPHVERIGEALAELARVTRRGGHLILEFYNPWSLRGLVKRWKRPTAIGAGVDDAAVFTRYDTLRTVREQLPPGVQVHATHGVRVWTPAARAHDVPLLGRALAWAEHAARDRPALARWAGFLVVVAVKT